MAAVLAPLQAIAGDLHGVNTRDYQPAKLAAMEGLWETEKGAPLVLFAIPDATARENRFEVAIPKLGSLIATRDINGKIVGLNDFEGVHPPVAAVFYSFRIMVGIGVLMLIIGLYGAWRVWRKQALSDTFLKILLAMTFSGWVATVAGWYVTEIGRQPWLVQGVLKTIDAVAELPPSHVALTLTAYLVTYAFLLTAFIFSLFYLARKEITQESKAS